MRKGQTHPSAILYKDFIIQAFLELIQEKKIKDITITELCERAKISRRTFYRHFDKKSDIAECYMLQLMQTLANTLTMSYSQNDAYGFTKSFFEFFVSIKDYVQIFISNDLGDILFNCHLKSMIPLYKESSKITSSHSNTVNGTDCKIAYTLGGQWSLLMYWLSTGCKQTPDELAEIVIKTSFN